MRITRWYSAAGALCALVAATPAWALTFGVDFASDYVSTSLGSPTGVPPNLGGLTFLNNNTLLIGGAANQASGALYTVPVVRDANDHITGFGGPATLFGPAPQNDGGVTFGPGGVLFVTTYSNNHLLQYKPGSTSPDKDINLATLPTPIAGSVGTAAFVPAGFAGAGDLKLASYSANTWYTVDLTADGSGTYNISAVSSPLAISGGPEGIVYIKAGNAGFAADSVLISEYTGGKVGAYQIDANGDPIPSTRRDFLTGLTGAEGAVVDPLTGDFLFSTFGGGNQVIVVQGFDVLPPPIPEPASLGLLTIGAIGLLMRRR